MLFHCGIGSSKHRRILKNRRGCNVNYLSFCVKIKSVAKNSRKESSVWGSGGSVGKVMSSDPSTAKLSLLSPWATAHSYKWDKCKSLWTRAAAKCSKWNVNSNCEVIFSSIFLLCERKPVTIFLFPKPSSVPVFKPSRKTPWINSLLIAFCKLLPEKCKWI